MFWRRKKQEPEEASNGRRPSGPEVATRALNLAALYLRGSLENDAHEAGMPTTQHISETERYVEWVRQDLLASATEKERRLWAAAPGSWRQQDVINSSWSAEAMAALMWALGMNENISPFDVQVDPFPLLECLPLMRSTSEFVQSATLRPADEIDAARVVSHEEWAT